MNRIGIISRKSYNNYGNMLQHAALSEAVRLLGYEPVTANYNFHGWKKRYQNKSLASIVLSKCLRRLRPRKEKAGAKLVNPVRTDKFRRFLADNTNLSAPVNTASELYFLGKTCDAFISGSDQVWAPMWYDPHYYLDFIDEDEKKIAYAASFGRDSVQKNEPGILMGENIAKFAHISVREQCGQKLVDQLAHRTAEWVLDPTLLLSAAHYNKMEDFSLVPRSPYLLCYFLGGRKSNWDNARTIAQALNLQLVFIPFLEADLKVDGIPVTEAGPSDFLGLFKKAAYICTDSFHGMAFSILYEKPFAVFERHSEKSERMSSRITSLLNYLGLENHFCADDVLSPALYTESIDFSSIHTKLQVFRDSSMDFLKKALARACEAPSCDDYKVTNTCCGCGACEKVCPRNAISIVKDAHGFRSAVVDQTRCIRCGKCRTVCPFNGHTANPLMDMKGLYAFKADPETLLHSSSGGFAHRLGEQLADEGYSVIGCVYDEEGHRALHRVAAPNDRAMRRQFQGSKYIQSNLSEAFAAISNGIEHGLFIGTPCQTAAIARLLGDRRKNWVLCDLICHGIPSENLWDKYLDYLNQKRHVGTSPQVNFRDKSMGWKPSHLSISGNSVSYKAQYSEDAYMQFYLKDFVLRDSCHECPYRQTSAADLRIGDYWGKRYAADKTGVNMIAALTEKGQQLLDSISTQPDVFCASHPITDYQEGQPCYNNPDVPPERSEILNAMSKPDIPLSQIHKKWMAPRYRILKLKKYYSELRKLMRNHR
ncbi:MAG: 4Fe-4S dicluster domain-containing protein [Clostridiales bacterium]|nr:4Fe-4S dicluster domain-containing protein [Clostridiales bacterium]